MGHHLHASFGDGAIQLRENGVLEGAVAVEGRYGFDTSPNLIDRDPWAIKSESSAVLIGKSGHSGGVFCGDIDDVQILKGTPSPGDLFKLKLAQVSAWTHCPDGSQLCDRLLMYSSMDTSHSTSSHLSNLWGRIDGTAWSGVSSSTVASAKVNEGRIIGSSQRISYGALGNPLTGELSVVGWFFATSNTGLIVHKGNTASANTAGWSIRLDSGTLKARIGYGSSNIEIQSVSTLSASQWYHLAFVIERGLRQEASLYLDGVRVALTAGTSGTGLPVTSISSDEAFYIGASSGNSDGIPGRVDEFALWERPLSSEEVNTIFRKVFLLLQRPSGPGTLGGSTDHELGSMAYA